MAAPVTPPLRGGSGLWRSTGWSMKFLATWQCWSWMIWDVTVMDIDGFCGPWKDLEQWEHDELLRQPCMRRWQVQVILAPFFQVTLWPIGLKRSGRVSCVAAFALAFVADRDWYIPSCNCRSLSPAIWHWKLTFVTNDFRKLPKDLPVKILRFYAVYHDSLFDDHAHAHFAWIQWFNGAFLFLYCLINNPKSLICTKHLGVDLSSDKVTGIWVSTPRRSGLTACEIGCNGLYFFRSRRESRCIYTHTLKKTCEHDGKKNLRQGLARCVSKLEESTMFFFLTEWTFWDL